jgi:hypothetical protein
MKILRMVQKNFVEVSSDAAPTVRTLLKITKSEKGEKLLWFSGKYVAIVSSNIVKNYGHYIGRVCNVSTDSITLHAKLRNII